MLRRTGGRWKRSRFKIQDSRRCYGSWRNWRFSGSKLREYMEKNKWLQNNIEEEEYFKHRLMRFLETSFVMIFCVVLVKLLCSTMPFFSRWNGNVVFEGYVATLKKNVNNALLLLLSKICEIRQICLIYSNRIVNLWLPTIAMGNSLVGIAPSQIFPLEHYMADIAELQLEKRSGVRTGFTKIVSRVTFH